MRIEFPQTELLSALTRTAGATLKLDVGQVLEGRVISSTRTTAIFETGAVRISARTEFPLPEGATVRLQVASVSPERIVLRLVPDAIAGSVPATLSETHLETALREMGLRPTTGDVAAGRALLRFGLPLDTEGVRSAAKPAGVPLENAPVARAFARYLGLPETDGVLRSLDAILSSGRRAGDLAADVAKGSGRGSELTVEIDKGDIAGSLKRATAGITRSIENALSSRISADHPLAALLASATDDASAEASLARHATGQQLVNSAHSQTRGVDACVYMQIPLLVQGEHRTLEIRVERDGPGGEIDPDHLTFAVRFGTRNLGDVEVSGAVIGDAVSCRFTCDSSDTRDALSACAPDLADGLRRNDLDLSQASFEMAREPISSRPPLCTPQTAIVARIDTHG